MIVFENIVSSLNLKAGDFIVDQFMYEYITEGNLFLVLRLVDVSRVFVYDPIKKNTYIIGVDKCFKKAIFVEEI